MSNITRSLIFGVLLSLGFGVARAQDSGPGAFLPPALPAPLVPADGDAGGGLGEASVQDGPIIAEEITPEIQALARGLENDPLRIFNYVHDHIRYVLYFGSKKGAQMTLLEKSGNDFDQSALLVALLRAAGYTNAAYRFGWMKVPFDNPDQSHRDLHHWLGLGFTNTDWTSTANYLALLFRYTRGYPADRAAYGDNNTFGFQRVWVKVTIGGTDYQLDPAFKVSEPLPGMANLASAMNFSSNGLMSAAAGTNIGSYVTNLNEANVRGKLLDYTTNLLAYLQSNYPNASVDDILGAQRIVPSTDTALSQSPLFPIDTFGGTLDVLEWANQPTNLMSGLSLAFLGTNVHFLIPELKGQRLTITFSNSVGRLWLEDTLLLQRTATGNSYWTNMPASFDHPVGNWDFVHNTFQNSNSFAHTVTTSLLLTNSTYTLVYTFEPDAGLLQRRQDQLAALRQQGWADNSRQVVSETLNVMGLGYMLQDSWIRRMLAAQMGALPEYLNHLGFFAQEAGLGYHVDIPLILDGEYPDGPWNDSIDLRRMKFFEVNNFFGSALEHGIIEQLQSTNLVAASTVKMLQLAVTNGQAIFLATNSNWTSGDSIRSKLLNYDAAALDLLDFYIGYGYQILLPQNGSNHLAGATSWAGWGFMALNDISMPMLINGSYHGGVISDNDATVNPPYVDQSGQVQPQNANPSPPTQPPTREGDPVNMVDGAFEIDATDLSLGGAEPRGLSLSRHYSSRRTHFNPAGMAAGWVHNYYFNATEVSAPEAALGGTTPAQMAPLLAATCAAIGIYNQTVPDPKNWVVTALIAKWGVDQLNKNGVSITLGKDTVQFIKQPNGAFTPPAGISMTLLKTNSGYWLQERHGNTFKFNPQGFLTNITDQYSQPLRITPQASNWVSTVTDWKGRSLTFNYSGTFQRLASVTDSTGRSHSFGYSTNFNRQGDLTSVTNTEGKTSTFLLDTNHQITATYNALSQLVTSNIFNAFGRVITQYSQGDTSKTWQIFWSGFENVEVDPAGGRKVYSYDEKSRVTGLQDALGNLSETAYDGQDHVVMSISPMNETSQILYDGNHNPIYTIDPLGFTNTLVYDSKFNLIQAIDARGNSSTFGYNTQFSLTGSTNGAGDWKTLTYNGDGTLATSGDSGGTNSYSYDTLGQLNGITYPGSLGSESFANSSRGDVTNHTNARGFVTGFQFNSRRQLTNTVAPTNLTMRMSYDAVGNLQTTTDSRNNATTRIWSPTSKLLSTTFPSTPQGSPVQTNVYDSRDWLARSANPLQATINYTNDAAGRLMAVGDPVSRTTRFGYDLDGRRTVTTNAALEVSQQTWNARGESPITIDGANNKVSRVFDPAGNNIYLTNRNGKLWQFQFDKANRVTNSITPLNRQTKVIFNDRGLPQTVTQPSGRAVTNTYDARNRLNRQVDSLGTITNQYDADNHLTSMAGNGQTNTWTYDAYDRLTSYKDADGNLIQYRRDANGNVTNLVYPDGKNVYYAFDSLNRMTNVTDWANRKTSFTYDLASRLTSITRPNATKRIISYDSAGETTNIIEQTGSGGPIAFYKLGWNSAARVDWEFAGPLPHAYTPPGRTNTFDDDNRLASFNGTTVTNDSDGNMIWAPLTNSTFVSLTFNARNQLLSAGGVSYGYDPAGNRTAVTNGTNIIRFVINPAAALSQALMRVKNGVTNYYVYGVELLYEANAAGNTKTYHYDYRGSTIALTDGSTNITDRVEYSIYGLTTYRAGSTDTPFLYNGRYGVMSEANGLLFMRSRFYNPYLCRFINADPSGFAGGLNWYAYGDGNPVSLIDPFGLGATESSGRSWIGNVGAYTQGERVGIAGPYSYYYGSGAAGSAEASLLNLGANVENGLYRLQQFGLRGLGMLGDGLDALEGSTVGPGGFTALGMMGAEIEEGIAGLKAAGALARAADTGAATLGSLTPSQARIIQAFSDRFGAEVNLVGSRAAGGGLTSDFDYVIGGNSSLRNSAEYYLPRGPIGTGAGKGVDIFNANLTPLDTTRPFIQFTPGNAPVVGPHP